LNRKLWSTHGCGKSIIITWALRHTFTNGNVCMHTCVLQWAKYASKMMFSFSELNSNYIDGMHSMSEATWQV
jgi:hypothetical protein